MLLLGSNSPIPLDVKVFHNQVKRVLMETEKYVRAQLGKDGAAPEKKLGYGLQPSMKGVFGGQDQAEEKRTSLMFMHMTFLQFIAPFHADSDMLDNINQALKDHITMATEANVDEDILGKVIDICAKTYVGVKAEGLKEEEAAIHQSCEILEDLTKLFKVSFRESYPKVFTVVGSSVFNAFEAEIVRIVRSSDKMRALETVVSFPRSIIEGGP